MQQMVYRYDGSLEGFLCCLYRAIKGREQPAMILDKQQMQSLLFEEIEIPTDPDTARLVAHRIGTKISPETMDFVRRALLTNLSGKEMYLLDFVSRAFREGPRVMEDRADPVISKLQRAVDSAAHEAHLYCGFVRFQVSGGVLCAAIEPKNRVLPLVMGHFSDRFSGESLLLYDKTHREALLSVKGRARIAPVESYRQPPADPEEMAFRSLWRCFFGKTAIQERKNPRCQMTHMPKRYWSQLTEMKPGPALCAPENRSPAAASLHS